MKKKILRFTSLLLAAGIMFSLAACGKKSEAVAESEAATEEITSEPAETETIVEAVTETETVTETVTEEAETLPEGMMYSYLTGEVVTEEEGTAKPVAVMINNISGSLPQSGISNAGILYEAVVEGSITRMLAVFESVDAVGDSVGSIRSSRPYYIDFAADEGAYYFHFGWSKSAETRIKSEGLDSWLTVHLMYIDGSYERISEKKAPHNVFSSTDMLKYALKQKGYDLKLPDDYQSRLNFNKEDTPIESGTDAYDVKIPFSSSSELTYDEESKVYLKYEYGHAQVDHAYNDRQLTFKNIIIQKAQYSAWNNDDELLQIALTGSGSGYYISDGKAVEITWKKDALLTDKTHYYLSDGSELYMNPGKTYIAVVPTDYKISFSGK